MPSLQRMLFRFVLPPALGLVSVSGWSQIVINEIHYNPDVKTELVEFVELHNAGPATVNLSGWQLTDAVTFTFPNNTTLASGGYLVVAANPAALQAKFGVSALGPWTGKLSSEGEKILLRNAAGSTEDSVEYQLGFPWPTVGEPPGYSIELINPAFDNDLGGNWRASVIGNPATQTNTLISSGTTWRYFKGTSEASTPTTTWRALAFGDASWLTGAAPIGYDPGLPLGTTLSDMRYNYTTVFFRKTFVVTNAAAISGLTLEALYDDGFKAWINGMLVKSADIATNEVPFSGTASIARETAAFSQFNLTQPQNYLINGTNLLAVQAANVSRDNSSDFFWDARLLALTGPASRGPTPGSMNSAFAPNAPPQIRQVDHSPNEPASGQPVTLTAKVTDPNGVTSVTLQYQVVLPGSYIELTDAAYANNWTSVAMNDTGTGGDAFAGDDIFTVVLPGSLQQHRRLIRYRLVATDGTSQTITVPYANDPQPNFAYFCYDGVPAWQGAVRPGVTPVLTFDTNVMRRLPAIHLLAKKTAVENATWFSRYGGDLYQWAGTLVHDGKVYDHIHYRARGGVWRYAMVKNMWKFDLHRGHDFQGRDNYGNKYDTKWTKLNLGAAIQQGDFGHRGEQGLFESVGFQLFNLAGVASPHTTFVQFRVIDEAAEAAVGNQYEGDFWGLYLAIEQENGRFLEEHDLPDGNLYKMEGGTGELNNLGELGPADKSDLNYFLGNYNGASDAWWRTNLNVEKYYSYQAIAQAIHHYDICYDKNFFYFRDPLTGLWEVTSWDLDLTWAHNMYDSGCGGLDRIAQRFLNATSVPGTGLNAGTSVMALTGARPAIEREFRNRLREIRDLLWNTNQAHQLIEEYAMLVRGPTNAPTFLDADRSMWDWNPKMASSTYSSSLGKAGQGRFYQWPHEPTVSKDFNGAIQLLKNYVVTRAQLLDSLSADASIPQQPTLTDLSPGNHPLNNLSFRASAYAGTYPFAAMKWRVGEISDTNAPAYDPTEPQPYEITSVWESPELTTFSSDLTLPADALKVGRSYRVRVRMKDNTGRWSRWSAPASFIVTEPEGAAALVSYLRVTEVMHNPPAGSDFEFIELHNTSGFLTLQLASANFTAGINYTFPAGTNIPPGGYLLVIKHASPATFRAQYGLDPSVPVAGPYSGSLANEGEELVLKTGAGGTEIFSFTYGNGRGWPVATDGAGHSLVPLNPTAAGQGNGALDYPGNWRASTRIGGSPGAADPALPAVTVRLNEITAHTDYNNPNLPDYDSNDWIELFNTTGTAIGLTNWFLSDDPADLARWAIPPTTIPARGWISFDEVTGFHSPITSGFGLDKAGEQVLLSYLPGNSEDRVVDAVAFKGQENDVSLGRHADGASFWYAMPRTRNAANAAGLTGIVISEVMYHPPDAGTNDNTTDEFIELFNPTASPLMLQDANGIWRMEGGISYTFPASTAMPAGGSLLLVSFSPTNAATLAAFRSAHGITNLSLPILGPYSGKLGNRGDRVALEKPQIPDAPGDPYSWVIVDEVIYGNQSPWPTNANGGGPSLQRLALLESGLDAANWTSASVTPGQANSDWDGDGLPNDWEILHSLQPDNPTDANLDADADGFTNLEEFRAGTDPQNAASLLKFDSVTKTGNTLHLQFTAVQGRTYLIQFRDSLSSSLWQTLTNISAVATTQPVTIPLPLEPDITTRFYQLVIPGPP